MVTVHGEELAAYEDHWHTAWSRGVPPGKFWDMGGPPALLSQFLKTTDIQLGGSAFVPGCGRGWDAIELAKYGCSVTGLDLCQEGVDAAQQTASLTAPKDLKGTLNFERGDFFQYRVKENWVDIGFDCTFFCVLQPHQYKDWAATWAKITKPGGCLITLQYPLDTSEEGTKNPPWPVSKQLYADLLTPHGFENIHQTETVKGCFTDRPGLAKKGHGGLEALAVWRKA